MESGNHQTFIVSVAMTDGLESVVYMSSGVAFAATKAVSAAAFAIAIFSSASRPCCLWRFSFGKVLRLARISCRQRSPTNSPKASSVTMVVDRVVGNVTSDTWTRTTSKG